MMEGGNGLPLNAGPPAMMHHHSNNQGNINSLGGGPGVPNLSHLPHFKGENGNPHQSGVSGGQQH